MDLAALRQVFAAYEDVQAVYLFGSHARKRARPDSDLDLAVVPRGPGARTRRLDMLADLVRAGFDNVDLVFLDRDDTVLKYQAVRDNQVVYAASDFDRGAMYSKVIRQYLDLQPYLEVQRRAYKERVLHGGS